MRRLLDGFSEASMRVSTLVTEQDQRLRAVYDEAIVEWKSTTADLLPLALNADLQTATQDLSRAIQSEAARAAVDTAAHLGVVAEFIPPTVELPSLEAVIAARGRREGGLDAEMALRTGLALTMGQGAGGLLTGIAATIGISVVAPLAIGIGLAIGALNARLTRDTMVRAKDQAQARRIVTETVGIWTTRARAETSTQLTRIRQYAEQALGEAVAERSAELGRQVSELQIAIAAARQAEGVRTEHEGHLTRIREERERLAETMKELRDVR
jgi:hypothetical protein